MLKSLLFPPLKLRYLSDPSISIIKRIGYVFDTVAWLLIVSLLLFWGYMRLFYQPVHAGNVQIYTREKQNIQEINATIAKVENVYEYLKNSAPICRNNAPQNHSVYLVNNRLLYTIVAPIDLIIGDTYAINILGSSFYQQVDLKHNIAHETQTKQDRFDLVLLHEMVHSCQSNTYGFVRSHIAHAMRLWVYEGYPTYLMAKYSHRDINDLHLSDAYIRYAKAVKHAIEQMHYSVDDLHRGKVDYDTVYKDMMKYYKSK